jgi:hypothetical protein
VESLVFNRIFPIGGMKDLKNAVLKKLDQLKNFNFKKAAWTPTLLRRILELLLSGFVAGAVQGRVSGLATATVAMGEAMLVTSSVLTTKFKTAKTFGFQPIQVPEFLVPLLTNWIKWIRPAIIQQIPSPKRRKMLVEPDAPLWINFQGNCPKASHFISKFFRSELQINISPNKIRYGF